MLSFGDGILETPNTTRRRLLTALAALSAASFPDFATSSPANTQLRNESVEYGKDTLPRGIRSRRVDNNNGATLHIQVAPSCARFRDLSEGCSKWRYLR
jgi:hypothetical protein